MEAAEASRGKARAQLGATEREGGRPSQSCTTLKGAGCKGPSLGRAGQVLLRPAPAWVGPHCPWSIGAGICFKAAKPGKTADGEERGSSAGKPYWGANQKGRKVEEEEYRNMA